MTIPAMVKPTTIFVVALHLEDGCIGSEGVIGEIIYPKIGKL
jgi:hypothetical protein